MQSRGPVRKSYSGAVDPQDTAGDRGQSPGAAAGRILDPVRSLPDSATKKVVVERMAKRQVGPEAPKGADTRTPEQTCEGKQIPGASPGINVPGQAARWPGASPERELKSRQARMTGAGSVLTAMQNDQDAQARKPQGRTDPGVGARNRLTPQRNRVKMAASHGTAQPVNAEGNNTS